MAFAVRALEDEQQGFNGIHQAEPLGATTLALEGLARAVQFKAGRRDVSRRLWVCLHQELDQLQAGIEW